MHPSRCSRPRGEAFGEAGFGGSRGGIKREGVESSDPLPKTPPQNSMFHPEVLPPTPLEPPQKIKKHTAPIIGCPPPPPPTQSLLAKRRPLQESSSGLQALRGSKSSRDRRFRLRATDERRLQHPGIPFRQGAEFAVQEGAILTRRKGRTERTVLQSS